MLKRILALGLCLLLVFVSLPFASAEGSEKLLYIESAEDFMLFAENCRLDSYSRGLRVELTADLDLSDCGFFSVPSFSGCFDGGGHSIEGVSITREGSVLGLFRYIEKGGEVKNLTLRADIRPEGSRSSVGGIAGSNSGTIINCRFEGSISGGSMVGGIAGENTVSGIIENCVSKGSVSGLHFVGGIAGHSSGVIRQSENRASINITEQENIVDIGDISVESIMSSESAGTVTDVGGISGYSCGVIRQCANYGDVGYKSMGYNIGGIAGSQNGYIFSCDNYAHITGRKEVGGIVGQMEPTALLEYSQDTFGILQGQLDGMKGTISYASSNMQSAGNEMGGQLSEAEGYVETAMEAIEILRDESNLDPDSRLAAENALNSSLLGMSETMQDMGNTTVNAVNSMASSFNSLQSQMNAMSSTLGNATDNLGLEITDVSDNDTPELLSAKVESCVNHGSVSADLNGGGVTGAISPANDLDSEDSISFLGEASYNIEGELRAVLLNSRNEGSVTVKKQNGGGIVGMQTMGLVRGCINRGAVPSGGAEYVGGISGTSQGFIRSCAANCALEGLSAVGGIAGSATVVSDCIALVSIEGSREKTGEILGIRQESETENPILQNYYLSTEEDIGGIDGVSYEGLAQGLSLEAFLALPLLPDSFKTVHVRFIAEDGSEELVSLPLGGSLEYIPAVPPKADYAGEWAGLAEAKQTDIRFDMSFHALYIGENSVIESPAQRENGLPVLLLQGSFTSEAELRLEECQLSPPLRLGERLVECWRLSLNEGETVSRGRYLVPEDYDPDSLRLMALGRDGNWQKLESSQNGSYLVFDTEGDFTALCLKQTAKSLFDVMLTASGITVVAIFVLVALLVSLALRNRKRPPQER